MKNKYLKFFLVAVIVLFSIVFGLYWLYGGKASPKSKAAGETMTLTFDPAAVDTTTDNQEFTVTLKVKPSVDVVLRGYRLNFPFDKTKLTLKTIDYKVGVPVPELADTTATIDQVNQKGKVDILGQIEAVTGTSLAAANQTDLVTLKFASPTSTSATTISIEDQMARFFAMKSDATLFNIPLAATSELKVNGGGPTATPGGPTVTGGAGTPTPTPEGGVDATVNFKLKFQGINKKPKDALNKLRVRLRLYDENTERYADVDVDNFTANDNGVWSGDATFTGVVPAHKYTLLVKGAYHIQKKVCAENPTETSPGTYRCIKGNISLTSGNNEMNLSGILLMVGDLPVQDGVVNAYDTSLIRNNLGKSTDEAVAKADVNRDGIVDTQDWSLVIAALSIRNDEL